MKTLHLIRHAKAAIEEHGIDDADRPLVDHGQQQANNMAQELKKLNLKPSLIISSPALRAITTAKIMAETLNYPCEKIELAEGIYSGGVEDVIELIKNTDASVNTLMLFGHNPTLTWLTHYLCEGTHMNIPTCGIIAIGFKDIKDWDQLTEVDGELLHFIHPPHEQLA